MGPILPHPRHQSWEVPVPRQRSARGSCRPPSKDRLSPAVQNRQDQIPHGFQKGKPATRRPSKLPTDIREAFKAKAPRLWKC